ncbi:MAG: SurA N-terminal domain-containing protein [Acidobacteriales bacterium]|nr:SurA N-terminal domain-containing protein [Terriglobales bacterium]
MALITESHGAAQSGIGMVINPTSRIAILLCALIMLFPAHPAQAGEIIDRIVATVNGHVILQSDWEDALRFEAFSSAQSLDALRNVDRKAALDRLIDQELLQEQMHASDFRHASDQEVDKKLEAIRKQYPGENWRNTLSRYGIAEPELRRKIAVQLDLMQLIDAHLRPSIDIDVKTVESYYNQQLLPQLRQAGRKELPLAEVAPKIKELLTQQKMDQLLTAWLRDLRAGGEIKTGTSLADPQSPSQVQ